jgi:hypothetical protein
VEYEQQEMVEKEVVVLQQQEQVLQEQMVEMAVQVLQLQFHFLPQLMLVEAEVVVMEILIMV